MKMMVPQADPETTALLAVAFDDNDERIVKIQKEVCDEIALRCGGQDCGPEIAQLVVSNKWGLATTMSMTYGNAMECVVPTSTMNALRGRVKACLEHAAAHASDLARIPHTDMPSNQCFALVSQQAMVLVGYLGNFTPWDKELRQKCYQTDRDFQYWRVKELGDCVYWIGHRGTESVVASWHPAYHEFLKSLKRTVDPNLILNRGILGLT